MAEDTYRYTVILGIMNENSFSYLWCMVYDWTTCKKLFPTDVLWNKNEKCITMLTKFYYHNSYIFTVVINIVRSYHVVVLAVDITYYSQLRYKG